LFRFFFNEISLFPKGMKGWAKGGIRQRKPIQSPCKGGKGWAKSGNRQRKPTQTPCKGGKGWTKVGHFSKKARHPIPQKRVIQLIFGNNIFDIHTIEEVCMNTNVSIRFIGE
jgi:hypothetical protein